VSATVPVDTRLDVPALLADGTHLIGGQWVAAVEGEQIDVINPANQDVLLRVPRGKRRDVDAAVTAAAAAFPAWRDSSPTLRANLLYRWAELCAEHEKEVDLLERMEVGHPHWGPSVIPGRLKYFAALADKITGDTLPTATPRVFGMTVREPFGVCGIIIPWNVPGPTMITDVAPALAAGNTIVVKPAEDAPLTCLFLAKLALEAGIPGGVVNIVTGLGTEAGAALPLHPLVRRMSFTGSPETGTKVMEACAQNRIPLHLELGGKSPQLVLRDANFAKAIPAIVGSITRNTGQICAAGSRLVVDKSVQRDLVSAIAEAFKKVRVGPWYEDVEMGPLISEKQEHRVLRYLKLGREEGAELVVGGNKLSGEKFDRGFYVEPTIFDQVKPDMRIAQDEIFGPVLSVLTFEDEAEGLEIANGTRYGLVASVWTNDISSAVRLARLIQAGTVSINSAGTAGVIGAPFGGYKDSGFGRATGADSILEYTQIKTIVINAE